MKKRIVTMLVAGMMLLSSTAVYARDISGVSGTSTSAQVSSSFTVEPNDLSQIVISVPENLDLTLNDEETFYTKDAVISAKGTLRDGYKLAISTGNTATYSASEHPDVTGTVTFGTQEWTSAQLAASNTTLDSRDINIKVNADDVTESATYTANVSFNVSVSKVNP